MTGKLLHTETTVARLKHPQITRRFTQLIRYLWTSRSSSSPALGPFVTTSCAWGRRTCYAGRRWESGASGGSVLDSNWDRMGHETIKLGRFPGGFLGFGGREECKPVAVEVQQLQRRGTATSALDGSAHLWWLELRSSGREGLWVGKKCNWKAAFGLDMRPINFLMMFIRRPEVHRALR